MCVISLLLLLLLLDRSGWQAEATAAREKGKVPRGARLIKDVEAYQPFLQMLQQHHPVEEVRACVDCYVNPYICWRGQ